MIYIKLKAAEKTHTILEVVGKNIEFEIESGSGISATSPDVFIKEFSNLTLKNNSDRVLYF